jgi:hypothetical protein
VPLLPSAIRPRPEFNRIGSDVQTAGLVAAVFLYELYLIVWRAVFSPMILRKRKMKQNSFDYSIIDWERIDREKAEFIYAEALGRLDSIHQNNDGMTNKALGLLTLAVPLLAALTGFFTVQWGGLSAPFLAASVCATAVLFATVIFLLLVLLPRGINPGRVEPIQYFTAGYYKNNMEDIFKGNIQSVQKMIDEDLAILNSRGKLFRVAILLFSAIPVVSGIAAAVTVALANIS